MNSKISNPFLKKLISEIADNANTSRIDLSWEVIEEAKKKKKLRKEAGAQQPAGGDVADSLLGGADATQTPAGQAQPAAAGAGQAPNQAGAAPQADPAASGSPEEGGDKSDADKAKEDAAKAKAELEKAKAEQEKAEEEIKDHQYVKLSSSGGTQFLLDKVLGQAFKTNTVDALAGEMVNKLKIETPEDMENFSDDMVTYMTIPGMPDLISSMRNLADKEPTTDEESEEPEQPAQPAA